MGILQSIFKPRDKSPRRAGNPKNSLGGQSCLFGGSASGERVNENTAMQLTAVFCCVRIISETLAGLPLHIYRYNADGGKEKAVKHPLYRILHDEPNPDMSSFTFRETLMSHLLLYGNAYLQFQSPTPSENLSG